MQWLRAVRQQAITSVSVYPNPCRYMASLGHNQLIFYHIAYAFQRRWSIWTIYATHVLYSNKKWDMVGKESENKYISYDGLWSFSFEYNISIQLTVCYAALYRQSTRHHYTERIRIIHYGDVIMSAMASQIIGVSIVCLTACGGNSKKTSKLRVIGLHERNPLVTGGFPSPRASNAANVFILWRHPAAHRAMLWTRAGSVVELLIVTTQQCDTFCRHVRWYVVDAFVGLCYKLSVFSNVMLDLINPLLPGRFGSVFTVKLLSGEWP